MPVTNYTEFVTTNSSIIDASPTSPWTPQTLIAYYNSNAAGSKIPSIIVDPKLPYRVIWARFLMQGTVAQRAEFSLRITLMFKGTTVAEWVVDNDCNPTTQITAASGDLIPMATGEFRCYPEGGSFTRGGNLTVVIGDAPNKVCWVTSCAPFPLSTAIDCDTVSVEIDKVSYKGDNVTAQPIYGGVLACFSSSQPLDLAGSN